jgi:hypothetical protein
MSLPNQWDDIARSASSHKRKRSARRIGRPNRARGALGAALLSERKVTSSRPLPLRRNAGVTLQQLGSHAGVTAQPSAATPFQRVRSRQATVSLMKRLIAWDRESWSVLAAPS